MAEVTFCPEMAGRRCQILLQSHSENPIWLMKSTNWLWLIAVLFAACLSLASAAAQALTTWKECTLIPTEWADGDSFQIQNPKGEKHTIRLYGADCIEWHMSDDSDARRLRAQRRYFGISESGGSPLASIQTAKDLGEAAAKEVVSALGEVTANRIIQARPFRKAEDLLNVEGIGPKTLERLQLFLQLPYYQRI